MKAPPIAKAVLSPSILLIGLCVYGYIGFTIYLSFTASTMMPVLTYTGPEAYVRLMGLGNWIVSVKNLGIFASLYIVGCALLGLGLAVLIDQKIRAESGFRSIFLYPMALSFIVTGTAWKWLMDPGIGLERTMHSLGWESFAFGWVKDSDLAIYCIVIAAVWQTSGFVMALFLAGLRGVDGEVINAARLDGAPTWRIYQRVIFPQLGASFISAFVILAHMAIKSYDLVIALTNGGPGRASWLPSLFMYQYTFTRNEMAIGAASAVLMLIAIAIVVVPHILRETRQGGSMAERSVKTVAPRVLLYVVLVYMALLFAMPLYVMLVNSLKPLDEIRAGDLMAWPHELTFQPWHDAWSLAQIGVQATGLKPYFINSFLMVVPAVAISTVIGALNGYVLTQFNFRGAGVVFALLMFSVFIPFQIVLIPMARTLGFLHLAGTVPGLIFVHVVYGLGFTTLFFRNYYAAFPGELVRSARMDGAGFFRLFWRLLLPNSGPIIVVAVIWQFTNIWNDFLFGASFSDFSSFPLTVALNNLVQSSTGVKEYNVHFAAAFIAAAPTLVVYIVWGKYFVRGLMAGSVKG